MTESRGSRAAADSAEAALCIRPVTNRADWTGRYRQCVSRFSISVSGKQAAAGARKTQEQKPGYHSFIVDVRLFYMV